jgi:hypothetical protein
MAGSVWRDLDIAGGRVKTTSGRISRLQAPAPAAAGRIRGFCMVGGRGLLLLIMVMMAMAASGPVMRTARADHRCDPIGEPGWRTVPSHEIVSEVDGAPYREGTGWFIDRTVTVLPLCNYFDEIGNYSLRSYSLSPRATTERIGICRSDGGGASIAIPPYAGPCPPR